MKNDILKIIFLLNGRKVFVKRYLKLLSCYSKKNLIFDLLIITDNKEYNFKPDPVIKNKVIFKRSGLKKSIKGINDIFRSVLINSINLNKYKYLIFVEDDNFVFPNAIFNCKKFMEKNPTFISSNGKSFIFSNSKEKKFLNLYNLPNSLESKNLLKRTKNYTGGIFYYSLIKTKIFIKIIKNVIKIKDNNLSEIFFNFLSIKYGKHKTLNELFLAREYPRPKIYNIPNVLKWTKYEKLLGEINIMSNILVKNIEKKNQLLFLVFTLYSYILKRVKNNLKKNKKYFKKKINKKYNKDINIFLKYLNKLF